ncbi:MAG: riboflavin synthase [Acidimicrobiia bacterium]
MFTGIVEAVGVITEVADFDGGTRLVIESPEVTDGLEVGDSIAVQGACLTATDIADGRFTIGLVSETLRRTSLGRFTPSDRVNLERAMPASGRFDGHIVQGHVDGVGTVRQVMFEGEGRRLTIECPSDLVRYVVEKGSITVDGVSLTVASLDGDGFDVALIPHTLAVTTMGALESSSRVNLEVDILAKYVERLMTETHR